MAANIVVRTKDFTNEVADELKKGAEEYRRKDVFELEAYTAKHLEVTRDGQTVVFEVTVAQGEVPSKARRLSPNPAELDRDKFEGFLAKLASLRATSFVPLTTKAGLDKPALTVYAKFADNKEERVTFGRVDNAVYAARPGEPDLAKIGATEFDEVVKAMDEFTK